MPRLIRRGLLGALLFFVGVASAAPRPVHASCRLLDLATIARTQATAVFAGTVTGIRADHVFMRVEAWFVGADPVGDAEIIGGRGSNDPGVITSVDWTPAVGEQYLVVAERKAPGGFVTKPCQQTAVTPDLVARATTILGAPILGAPILPPFATVGPPATSDSPALTTPSPSFTSRPTSTGPDGSSPTGSGLDPVWVVFLAMLAIGAVLFGFMRARRDPHRGPDRR